MPRKFASVPIKDIDGTPTICITQRKTKRVVSIPLNDLAQSLLPPRDESNPDALVYHLVKKSDNISKYVRRIDFARVNLRDIEYSTMVPVFLQVKYNFLNKVVSPYIDLKGGMMTDYTFSGTGWFVSPSIGLSFCRRFSIFAAAEGTVNQYGRGTGKDYQKADIHPWSVGFTVNF